MKAMKQSSSCLFSMTIMLRMLVFTLLFRCFLANYSYARDVDISPGVYSLTIETFLPNLETTLRNSTTRSTACLLSVNAKTLFPVLKESSFSNCALQEASSSSLFNLVCSNPEAATGTAVVSQGTNKFTAYLKIKMGGKNMKFSQSVTGVRAGDCKQ